MILFGPAFTVWLLIPLTLETYVGLAVFAVITGLCLRFFESHSPGMFDRLADFVESSSVFSVVWAVEITLTALVLGLATDLSQTFVLKAVAFGVLSGAGVFVMTKLFDWYESV
ncbi:MAG TPA: hypothetical protein VFS30_07845 [Dehalococcoidia bacterium]|nr:hypothetical protein [Dehalococcoidia bacterium]